ncbi:MAG: helix-turn-helix domain-containing protein [Acidimicrobiales bacterium]
MTEIVPQWTFGDRLRKARLHAELQLEDIAVAFRVSRVTVSKWELNKTQPSNLFQVVEGYAQLTGVSSDWLLTGTDP